MSDNTETILEQVRERIAKAKISEEAREELEFQAESFAQRFSGQVLEGEALKAALDMFLDAFSVAYRLALTQGGAA